MGYCYRHLSKNSRLGRRVEAGAKIPAQCLPKYQCRTQRQAIHALLHPSRHLPGGNPGFSPARDPREIHIVMYIIQYTRTGRINEHGAEDLVGGTIVGTIPPGKYRDVNQVMWAMTPTPNIPQEGINREDTPTPQRTPNLR